MLLAIAMLAPACTAALDFNELSRDWGNGGAGVATVLAGQRIELACTANDPSASYLCMSDPKKEQQVTLTGNPAVTYDLQLRFRGVVEMSDYTGGDSRQSPMYAGGMPSGSGRNVYALSVSNPEKTYYLNSGTTALYCTPLDYSATLSAQGNATIKLSADPFDDRQLKNLNSGGTPIVVPGVPPLDQAFAGQFIQIDVLSAAPTP
jgi:hypothetical protein